MEIKDKIVQQVIDKYTERSATGIKKYGTTLEENNKDNYLIHLQQELMDASLYIEKLLSQIPTPNPTRYYNDKGEVGVLISTDYGSGFSKDLESKYKDIVFNPTLIQMVLDRKKPTEDDVRKILNVDDSFAVWGLDNLEVEFIPRGTKFMVEDYDGYEYIITERHLNLTA